MNATDAGDDIPGVDLGALRDWMDVRGLGRGPLTEIEALAGGTQNVLVRFRRGGQGYVLRRPPVHKRRNSDETMRREARVLGALAGTDVPHPRLIAAEPDTAVLGAAFYLMEPVSGFNPSVGLPPLHAGDPGLRHRMGIALAEAAAALGEVDHEAVGLGDFGRPEGYLERQVPRWWAHLESYGELDGYPGPRIPHLERVRDWLEANRPAAWTRGILHGDLHLANVLYRLDGPELAAVVDWELATIGDPLVDLGLLVAFWPDESGELGPVTVQPWEGFPTTAEMVAAYRERSSRDTTAVDWYAVLACYRTGIILEGTNARAHAGLAPREVGDLLHATTVRLFEKAARLIAAAGDT